MLTIRSILPPSSRMNTVPFRFAAYPRSGHEPTLRIVRVCPRLRYGTKRSVTAVATCRPGKARTTHGGQNRLDKMRLASPALWPQTIPTQFRVSGCVKCFRQFLSPLPRCSRLAAVIVSATGRLFRRERRRVCRSRTEHHRNREKTNEDKTITGFFFTTKSVTSRQTRFWNTPSI